MWYAGYVSGGFTTKGEGWGKRVLRQFYVEREVIALGVECWAPRRIDFIRSGYDRRASPVEILYLPNYVIFDVPADRFHDVLSVKYLRGPLMALNRADIEYLPAFRKHVMKEYDAARERAANQEVGMCEYRPDQTVTVVSGPLAGRFLKFIEMVERAHDLYPKIKASMDLMGRVSVVELDPIQVKAAE